MEMPDPLFKNTILCIFVEGFSLNSKGKKVNETVNTVNKNVEFWIRLQAQRFVHSKRRHQGQRVVL